MKKMLRLLLSVSMLAVLIVGMQITASAALSSSPADEASIPANETASTPDATRTDLDDTSVPDDTGRLNDVNNTNNTNDINDTDNTNDEANAQNNVTIKDIQPINANPDTGAVNPAIPAAVALLAASVAAIAFSAKKRS